MTKHRVFYSFHYQPDNWRVSMVRNIGALEDNKPASDNDLETITKGGNAAIIKWIDDQMKGRSCTVVLVGGHTAGRKWINYEIMKSWEDGMGVVGIHIHGLKGSDGKTSTKGNNPFTSIYSSTGKELSSIVKCYDPAGSNSQECYNWIKQNSAAVVAEANKIRNITGR